MLVLLCCRCCEMAPSQLPAAFIKVTKTKNTISCTTADLVSRYVTNYLLPLTKLYM